MIKVGQSYPIPHQKKKCIYKEMRPPERIWLWCKTASHGQEYTYLDNKAVLNIGQFEVGCLSNFNYEEAKDATARLC